MDKKELTLGIVILIIGIAILIPSSIYFDKANKENKSVQYVITMMSMIISIPTIIGGGGILMMALRKK